MWIFVLALIAVAEGVLVGIVRGKTNDKNAALLAGSCFDLVAGAVTCAVISFDMQMIQVAESYYVDDVVRKDSGFTGRVGEFLGIELSAHGIMCAITLAVGAALIAVGLAGIAVAFYGRLCQESSSENVYVSNKEAPMINENQSRSCGKPMTAEVVPPQGEGWTCRHCGQLNKMVSMQCKSCGKYKTS